MLFLKNIFLIAALALGCSSSIFAAPLPVFKEAAARWTQEQALKLPPAMTAEFLQGVADQRGPEAAARLAEKKEKVAALLGRYKKCDLRASDAATAEKYFTPEFGAEVRYFAAGGCEAFRSAAQAQAQARPGLSRPASVNRLEALSASGALATQAGSARFFDGSSSGGSAALPAVHAAQGAPRPAGAAVQYAPAKVSSKPLAAGVPALRAENPFRAAAKIERPADLGKDGRVNTALAYWNDLRKKNWAAYKDGGLEGSEKAKALLKAAAGAGFGGLLYYSNLPNVEIAAARLGWDVGRGESRAVIAADAAKLAFHSGVFILALAPIPVLKVARAAAAGEAWALALMAGFAAGPVNRYIFHFAD
ncbi:MAG: hypothetical protein A2X32_06025 [Elusimicrobia bacterium GWC2_64_44]|nr:MAG: hypothetical protein A2X32_06025 [Elusimicrobia bacterium GWC2_64_44]